jgi:hypothetical protein
MLKQGERYFADYELFFPGFAVGVTDYLSIGGGVSILPVGLTSRSTTSHPKLASASPTKFTWEVEC